MLKSTIKCVNGEHKNMSDHFETGIYVFCEIAFRILGLFSRHFSFMI